MLATEPLPRSFWDAVGLRRRETFTGYRHLIVYGQRTADDRLAFGGAERRTASVLPSVRRSTATRACSPRSGGRWSTCCPQPPTLRSPTPGVGRSVCRGTGSPPSGWTASRVSAGPVGTSGTASGRPTSPVARLADLVLCRDTDLVRLPWPSLAALGAGAAALARRERRPAGDVVRRRRRGAPRPTGSAGAGGRAVPRQVTVPAADELSSGRLCHGSQRSMVTAWMRPSRSRNRSTVHQLRQEAIGSSGCTLTRRKAASRSGAGTGGEAQ